SCAVGDPLLPPPGWSDKSSDLETALLAHGFADRQLARRRHAVAPSPPRTEFGATPTFLTPVGEREGVRGMEVSTKAPAPHPSPAPSPLPSPPLHGRRPKPFSAATAGERAWRGRCPLTMSDALPAFRTLRIEEYPMARHFEGGNLEDMQP